MQKQYHLKKTESKRQPENYTYNYHEAKLSMLRRLFLQEATEEQARCSIPHGRKGCKFDGWDEYFEFDKWMEAFEECGIDPKFYANRKRALTEILPWDHINMRRFKEIP